MKTIRQLPKPVILLALALAATLGAMMAWAGIYHLLSRNTAIDHDTAMGVAAASSTLVLAFIICIVAQRSTLRPPDPHQAEPEQLIQQDPTPDPDQPQTQGPTTTRQSYRDILSGRTPREEHSPPR